MNALEGLAEKYRNDPRSTQELISLAVTKDPDDDDEGYWFPIGVLQHRIPEVLALVADLLRNDNDKARETAGTILGQSRRAEKCDIAHCIDMLEGATASETETRPLSAMLHALGHLHDERIIPIVMRFRGHPCADVRFAVTHALHGFESPDAVEALIELSADPDEDVRNWATFNLGSQIDIDTPAIRDALTARLNELDDEIRGEAIVGLARRGDARFIAPLISIFDRHAVDELRDWLLVEEAINRLAETATNAPASIWLPVLLRAKQLGVGNQADIQIAIAKCDPDGANGQLK